MSYGKYVRRGRERKIGPIRGLKLWQVLWVVYKKVYGISVSIYGKYYRRYIE